MLLYTPLLVGIAVYTLLPFVAVHAARWRVPLLLNSLALSEGRALPLSLPLTSWMTAWMRTTAALAQFGGTGVVEGGNIEVRGPDFVANFWLEIRTLPSEVDGR